MPQLITVEERPGKYAIWHNRELGYVRLEFAGFMTREDGLWCHSVLNALWNDTRKRHGRVLFLVDASNAQVQAPDLIREMAGSNPQEVVVGDRIAFVVASSLLKVQLKRETDDKVAAANFFMSLSAAETWLLAHDHMATRTRHDVVTKPIVSMTRPSGATPGNAVPLAEPHLRSDTHRSTWITPSPR